MVVVEFFFMGILYAPEYQLTVPIAVCARSAAPMLCLDGQYRGEEGGLRSIGNDCNHLVIQTKRFLKQQATQVEFASSVIFMALSIHNTN